MPRREPTHVLTARRVPDPRVIPPHRTQDSPESFASSERRRGAALAKDRYSLWWQSIMTDLRRGSMREARAGWEQPEATDPQETQDWARANAKGR